MTTTAFKQTKNNSAGTLKTQLLIAGTTITLDTGQGAAFPSAGPFWVTLFGTDPSNGCEVVLVGGRTGDNLTSCTRAQQSTSAAQWEVGNMCQLLITSQHFTDIHTAVNALETMVNPTQAVTDIAEFVPTKCITITVGGATYRIALDPV